MKILNIVLFLTIFLFISCYNESNSEDLDFLNTVWTLQHFNIDCEIVKPPEGQVYTIQFDTDSTFSGINDCNDLVGKYNLISENKIEVINAGGSYANCGDNSLFLDYMSALQSAESYEISGDKLTIFYENKSKLIFYGQEF